MAGPINIAQHYVGIEPVTRKHYGLGKDSIESQFDKIAKVDTVDEPIREFVEWGGPAQLQLKRENTAMRLRAIIPGPLKRVQAATYAGAIEISREAVMDHKVKEVKTAASSLGRATKKTPEYLFAQFLDRSHSTSYPVTADNVALCSASHVTPYGTTFANTLATPAALSETALEDVMTALRTIPGPDTMLSPVMKKQLIVPSALAVLAEKLSTSQKTLGSANNDPSYVRGTKVMVFDYLTNTTRWFLQTDAENGLYWDWREKDQFERDNVALTLQAIFIAFFRAMWGGEDPRCIYGSDAS